MSISLDHKVAIVTGSGAGLGAAYAKALAAAGAAVVVNDVSESGAAAVVAEIRAAGGRARAVVAPVGTSAVAQQLVDAAVGDFGRLDVVVTNAGVLRDKSLLKMTDEDFDAVIDVHLRGTFTIARAAFGHFKEHAVPGASSRSAPPRVSAATSARRTTRRRRPASSAWSAPGRSR